MKYILREASSWVLKRGALEPVWLLSHNVRRNFMGQCVDFPPFCAFEFLFLIIYYITGMSFGEG